MISRRRFPGSAASLGALAFAQRGEALEEGQPSRTRSRRRCNAPFTNCAPLATRRRASSEEANERYFKGRSDGFRVRGSGRIMAARV
jgi:hypothetical protein